MRILNFQTHYNTKLIKHFKRFQYLITKHSAKFKLALFVKRTFLFIQTLQSLLFWHKRVAWEFYFYEIFSRKEFLPLKIFAWKKSYFKLRMLDRPESFPDNKIFLLAINKKLLIIKLSEYLTCIFYYVIWLKILKIFNNYAPLIFSLLMYFYLLYTHIIVRNT